MKGITKRDIGLPQNVIHLSSYEDVKKTIEDKPNDHAFDEVRLSIHFPERRISNSFFTVIIEPFVGR